MQLPRDLAALVEVNKPGPAWTSPSNRPDAVGKASGGKKKQGGEEKEQKEEGKKEVGVKLAEEEKQAVTEAESQAEIEAERAALAVARQRVSIPAPAVGQELGGAIEVGMGCDVEQHDEGLVGSRYSAAVRQLWPLPKSGKKKAATQALVEYDTLFDEGEGGSGSKPRRLQEWIPISSLHPVPPLPRDGWTSRVCPGDQLEALYEGGWWTVVVVARDAATVTPPTVDAEGSQAVTTVALSKVDAEGSQAVTVAPPMANAGEDGTPSAESADVQHSATMPMSSRADEGASDSTATFVTKVVGYDGLQRTFLAVDLRPPLGSKLL